ncbi:GNAT family N-acetyltransferase [Acinetobacter sp. WCHAc060025]|uniref:GNAT family N-acetyltransferase n=1 Tax=Acinetobacter sp. WCHAc060025 TaxID=2518625 RepID=UPI001022D3C8|nr:GNAT family N-acetyltransferase [Acinetobacter sp. WCHAc060025]RZG71984.1 N-acetyltransferase [Acinetobacter sp. WCHAc060025]
MKKLKVLTTPRLILDEIGTDDAAAIFELFSNDAVLEFYDVKKLTRREKAHDLVVRFHQKWLDQQAYRYAIRLKDENFPHSSSTRLIGSFGVNRVLEVEGKYGVVIGCELHPDYWQKGYMSEVLSRILMELKTQPLFEKKISFVVAEVYEGNVGSMNLLLKHGFQQVKSKVAEQIRLNLEISARQIFKQDFE